MRVGKLVRCLAIPLAGYGIGVALALFSTLWFGSLSGGLNQPDEPSHFLNSVFVRDYLRSAVGSNPMRFATNYYLHYPKLAIGQWPPAYYGLFGMIFLVVPATPKIALVLNVLVSALPALGVAAIVYRFFGALPALLASVWYITLPLVIWAMQFFLLDQPLTSAILAAAGAWVWFSVRPTLPRALLVSILASFAVLIKGNGWLVALFPLLHIAFTGQWRLLREKYTYVSLVVALLLVVPWYAVTTGITADSFNYKPGLAYAWAALQANVRFLIGNVGPATLILAGVGACSAWAARRSVQAAWGAAAACLALISAMLLFQSLAPADLADRYIAPALPPLIVLACFGIGALAVLLRRSRHALLAKVVTPLVILAAVYPSLLFMASPPAKGSLRLDMAADRIMGAARPAIWIIDGSTSAEGSLIAEVAIRDPGRQIYVVRSSQLLAASDFMGRGYRLKYSDPAAVIREIQDLQAEGVILVEQANEKPFEHSAQLRAALMLPDSGYRQVVAADHPRVAGKTELYEASEPRAPNLVQLRETNFPSKATALGAAQ
jgi:hypothetical protein